MSSASIDLATVVPCGVASNEALAAILAAGHAAPRYVLMLSPGARALPGAVAALREALEQRAAAGAAGGLVLDERGRFVASHAAFPSLGHELLAASGAARRLYGPWFPSRSLADSAETCAADWVSGACLLVRREALAATGLFDQQLAEGDALIDWCFRLRRAAWELLYVPGAVVVHEGGPGAPCQAQLVERYRSRVRLLRRLQGPAAAAGLKLALAGLAALGRLRPLGPRQIRLALRDV